tara:strand:- start:3294 stop:3980 length:687 start_codon:yes stop_codon:yes gene_type:complete
MSTNIPSAIVLCGGKGMRLRPLTIDTPKPLIEINNKPILFYIIKHLVDYGIKDIYVATGYKSKQIEKFMENNFHNINYKIVNSGDVDILYRIKDCLKYIKNDFMICYGDTISNVDIKKLIKFHKKDIKKVTITSYPISIPFGLLEVNKTGKVKSFREKPILNEFINIGYFYFTYKYHHIIMKKRKLIHMLYDFINKGKLKSYKHKGIHITINTLAELDYAKKNIRKIS